MSKPITESELTEFEIDSNSEIINRVFDSLNLNLGHNSTELYLSADLSNTAGGESGKEKVITFKQLLDNFIEVFVPGQVINESEDYLPYSMELEYAASEFGLAANRMENHAEHLRRRESNKTFGKDK